jgi:hypothetical protein
MVICWNNSKVKSTSEIITYYWSLLFNTEYRLMSHKVEIIKQYKLFKGNKLKCLKIFTTNTIIIDNAIYWLDRKLIQPKKEVFSKKYL